MQILSPPLRFALILCLVLTGLAAGPAAAQTTPDPKQASDAGYADILLQGSPPPPSSTGPTPTSTGPGAPGTVNTNPKTAKQWGNTCWTCGFFETVNDARVIYGKQIFELVAEALVPLLSAILGVWMLIQAAQLLTPFGPMEGGARTLSSVFIRILLAILVLAMIRNYPMFWLIHTAVADAGAKTASEILRLALDNFAPTDGLTNQCPTDSGNPALPTPGFASSGEDLKTLAISQGDELRCTLSQMQAGLGVGMSVGVALIDDVISKPFWAILQAVGGIPIAVGAGIVTGGESTWVIMRFIAGMILFGVFGLASFLMAFRFIDIIVKWTVITIFAPLFVMMVLFRNTRQISTGGLKMMLADALTLVFMAVILSVMVAFFGYVLSITGTSVKTMQDLAAYDLKRGIADPIFWHLLVMGLMTLGLLTQAASWAGFAVSMPAMLHLTQYGTKAAEALQGAIGRLVPQAGGLIANQQWKMRQRLNTMLRRELQRPRPVP
jgi:hypothetical protein